MAKVTFVLHSWGHQELQSYLLSLEGIQEVSIENNETIKIEVTYEPSLISAYRIRLEIYLFLNHIKGPSVLLAFDKHFEGKLACDRLEIKNLCCEYCYMSGIDTLFEKKGIEKAEGNYDPQKDDRDVFIDIFYNPEVLTLEDIKQIEKDLDL